MNDYFYSIANEVARLAYRLESADLEPTAVFIDNDTWLKIVHDLPPHLAPHLNQGVWELRIMGLLVHRVHTKERLLKVA